MTIGVFGGTGGRSSYSKITKSFFHGVRKHTSDVFFEPRLIYKPCDIAVIFGSCRMEKHAKAYHMFKYDMLYNKIHKGRFIYIESGLLNRKFVVAHNNHWRIGVDHFMLHKGKFGWRETCPNDRLKELNVDVKPWKKDGDHILLCLQILNDASLLGINYYDWTNNVIQDLLDKSDKNIVIRLHPNTHKKHFALHFDMQRFFNEKRITFSHRTTLNEDLKNAYCAVSFSSGSGIDAIVNGVPHIALHPGSMVYPVSAHSIDEINDLPKPDRTNILRNLAYSQWTPDEMKKGLPWKHLKNHVFDIEDKESKLYQNIQYDFDNFENNWINSCWGNINEN